MKKTSKLLVLLLALMLVLSACDGQTQPAAPAPEEKPAEAQEEPAEEETPAEEASPAEETEPEQQPEETPAEEPAAEPETPPVDGEGETVKPSLDNSFKALDPGTYSIDLDQDGKEETVTFAIEGENEDSRYSLDINGQTKSGEMCNPTGRGYVGSLDGKTLQLLLDEVGPSDDPVIYVFGWDGTDAYYAGLMGCSMDSMYVENGVIHYKEVADIFQTIPVPKTAKLENGTLVVQEQDFYEFGNEVTATCDIETYADKSTDAKGITLNAGDRVNIVGTDNVEWVEVERPTDGQSGWIHISDYYMIDQPDGEPISGIDAFQGLILAG